MRCFVINESTFNIFITHLLIPLSIFKIVNFGVAVRRTKIFSVFKTLELSFVVNIFLFVALSCRQTLDKKHGS